MELTLYQVIAILNQLETKDKKFYRVGDKDFKIFKGSCGDLIYKIDNFKPVTSLNYLNDDYLE